jgi:hypothetical protein
MFHGKVKIENRNVHHAGERPAGNLPVRFYGKSAVACLLLTFYSRFTFTAFSRFPSGKFT